MRILVTGGCGFIGSHLVEKLTHLGHEVTVIDNLSTGQSLPQYGFVKADIRDCDFPDCDIIFHVAAKASIPDSLNNPYESHTNNVNGTLRVIEFARTKNIPIIFSGSSSVYDDHQNIKPVSPYALQKLICEQYLELYQKLYGLQSVVLRYFSVYGPRQPDYGSYQTVMSIFLNQKKAGLPFTITGNGEQRRDFVHVQDVVAANIEAAKKIKGFEVKDIGTGVNHSVNEVADMIDPKHPKEYIAPRIEPFATLCKQPAAPDRLKEWLASL